MAKSYRVFISNYLVVAVLALTTILSTPIIFKHLGASEWAYVAITISVQAFLGLLDFGMIQLIPRDIAREITSDARKEVYDQYVFNYVAIPLALFPVSFLFICSGLLQASWNNEATVFGFYGGGLYVLQSLNLAHYAVLNGLGLQLTSNRIQSISAILRVLGVLICVTLISARAVTYVVVSAIFYSIEFLTNVIITQRAIRGRAHPRLSKLVMGLWQYLSHNWKMMFGVSIGVLGTNLDRLMLMPKIDLPAFGIYVLVLNFALNALNLQYPLFKNLLADACSSGPEEIRHRSRRVFMLNLLICVLPCLGAGLLARPILAIWSHNSEVAARGAWVFGLVLLAVAVNSLHHLNYLKQIFWNEQRWISLTHIVSLLVCAAYLAVKPQLTIVDGGVCWLISNLVQFGGGIIWSMRRYLRPISFTWYPPP